MPKRAADRRAWTLSLLLWPLAPALSAPPLPQRNLAVELRVVESGHMAGQGGQVTLSSRGRGEVAGAMTLSAGARQQSLDAQQRVLVLNGARATLRLSQGVLVDDTEVAWTPWGPAAAVRSQWVELVNGIDVAPRWPGGDAPVTVELSAQRAGGGVAGTMRQSGTPAQWTLLSTVQVPLGEWLDVAQVGERQPHAAAGGFGAATASRQRSLQLRVSLP
jgi:hypothetical protein